MLLSILGKPIFSILVKVMHLENQKLVFGGSDAPQVLSILGTPFDRYSDAVSGWAGCVLTLRNESLIQGGFHTCQDFFFTLKNQCLRKIYQIFYLDWQMTSISAF